MLSQQDVRFTFSRVDDSAFAVVRVTLSEWLCKGRRHVS